MHKTYRLLVPGLLLGTTALPAAGMTTPANQDGWLGLYPSQALRVTTGTCQDCATIPQALWYFREQVIAVPASASQATGYSTHLTAQQDVERWASQASAGEITGKPPLIWLGASQVITQATLATDGTHLRTAQGELPLTLAPKLASNQAYFNADSLAFFSQRPLRLRGEQDQQAFQARTLWPLDFSMPPPGSVQALVPGETLQTLVRSHHGGAQQAFSTRILWQRPGAADWHDSSALGVMLNGAQGDDDEAHGGHFGIVTGRYQADGDWSRWLVNNFYNLDSVSEKGIIAAPLPMDNYLMDLNSGQSYYRPSYMLVAVLRRPNVAALYQGAVNRVYQHFYRHDLVYRHAAANCAGISMDTLRSLGWHVPNRGNGGLLKGTAAYVYVAATSRDLRQARSIYDYIVTEDTRLNPPAAFDALGEDLLALAQGTLQRPLSPLEQQLADDLQAVIYVHIPQVPSSRAWGQAPVYSFDEYRARAPADRADWKIIRVAPRPFPPELKDGLALKVKAPALMPWPIAVLVTGILAMLAWGFLWWKRRKQ